MLTFHTRFIALFSIEAFVKKLQREIYHVAILRVKSAFIVTLVVGLFFLHPMATKHTFRLLACEEISTDDWRMLTDLEQRCDFADPTYIAWLSIGIGLLVV